MFTGGASSLIGLSGTELEITDPLIINGTTGTEVTISADSGTNDTLVAGTFITDVFNNTKHVGQLTGD